MTEAEDYCIRIRPAWPASI